MSDGWMLPDEVITWINDNLSKECTILEFGSGHGSVALSSRFQLISVEHDEKWLNLSNGRYIHAEIVQNPISSLYEQTGWYNAESLVDLPTFVELIIVDGPPGNIGRIGIIHHLASLPKSNYWIIDDTDREAEALLLESLVSKLDVIGQIEIISSARRGNGEPRKSTVLMLR
ncbi:MAG: hypothetical protein CBC63_01175 [Euryarchaeota archaeon TMED103]|nr:MAG: hypothetical protein CBC63_01175 [Euryarchaeota archaeon TMED103]